MSDVRISGLTVRLGGATVVEDVSLHVRAGEWLGLVGPNGAGKTTILLSVAGVIPYDGSVFLDDVDAAAMNARRRAHAVALVPQRPSFPVGMSVTDYVLLGRTPYVGYFEVETARDRQIAKHALERLAITRLAARSVDSLSGGEQQRAVLARALAQRASVLLLDEGTSALDLGGQQAVLELVDELHATEGLTVISAMHDLTFAAQYAERLALVSGGRLIAVARPVELLSSELIFEHYRAFVRVGRDAYGVFVSPTRHRCGARGVSER